MERGDHKTLRICSFGIGGRLAALGVSLLIAAGAHAETRIGTGDAEAGPGNAQPRGAPVDLADRNGDGLADGLAAALAVAAEGETVDVIVTLTRPSTAAALQRAVGPFAVTHEYHLINGFAASVNAGQARALARLPSVFRVEPVYTVTGAMESAKQDTGVTNLRAALAPNGLGTGAGIGVCIVDSGIQADHEQFTDELGVSKVQAFFNVITDQVGGPEIALDDVGHGTGVASVAAGDGTGGSFAAPLQGVAPGAALYVARALQANLDGFAVGEDADVLTGVEWCADQAGVHVINLSLIGDDVRSDGLDAMSLLVNAAVQSGKVVVAGVGNSDDPGDLHPPGAAALVITAGAFAEWSDSPDFIAAAYDIDPIQGQEAEAVVSNGPYVAPFSGRGLTSDGRIKPDIVAPGVTIAAGHANVAAPLFNCGTGCYEIVSGTSFSTPFISGVVALMLEANPALTPDDVRQILYQTAQDRGVLGPGGVAQKDGDWGFGMVDAYAAVAMARSLAGDDSLGSQASLFPSQVTAASATVRKSDSVTLPFTVTDNSVPLAVTVTGPHDGFVYEECTDFIFFIICIREYRPDLDATLYKVTASGDVFVAQSICPLEGECGPYGLQETIKVETPELGDYKLVVEFLDVPGTPSNLRDATFTYEISQGPLAPGNRPAAPNQPPVANAGGDINAGQTVVTLDGSASSDADGAVVFYAWHWDGGNATGVAPQITLPPSTTTAVTLTVVDDLGATSSDEVLVTVSANQSPVASIVADASSYLVGDTVALDGTSSSDPDGDAIVAYSWSFASLPRRSNAVFDDPTSATPTFVPDKSGDYRVQLVVTDARGGVSAPAELVVSVAKSSGGGGSGGGGGGPKCNKKNPC